MGVSVCGGVGGIQEPPQVPAPAGTLLEWMEPKGYGGGWQARLPGVTEMRLHMEPAWEHEDLHLEWSSRWLLQASCWTPVSLIRYFPHQHD